jgi:hypothetical protein
VVNQVFGQRLGFVLVLFEFVDCLLAVSLLNRSALLLLNVDSMDVCKQPSPVELAVGGVVDCGLLLLDVAETQWVLDCEGRTVV